MSSTATSGIYVGTDGIKLGDNFKVTTGGSLTASTGIIGAFNISSGSLLTSLDASPTGTNLQLYASGSIVAYKILFNDTNVPDTEYKSYFPGAVRMANYGTSYTSSQYVTNYATDYLFPWGVVSAYTDILNYSKQNIMPFDSVLSMSPAMRNVSYSVKYYNGSTGSVNSVVTQKRVGPHFGLYIWAYDETLGDDSYAEKSAADMGFVGSSPYLFGVVSQRNIGDISQYDHQNKLSTCVVLKNGQYLLRVYNDDGNAKNGFVCFVIGIISDYQSVNNLYCGAKKLANYAGSVSGYQVGEGPFLNNTIYVK